MIDNRYLQCDNCNQEVYVGGYYDSAVLVLCADCNNGTPCPNVPDPNENEEDDCVSDGEIQYCDCGHPIHDHECGY